MVYWIKDLQNDHLLELQGSNAPHQFPGRPNPLIQMGEPPTILVGASTRQVHNLLCSHVRPQVQKAGSLVCQSSPALDSQESTFTPLLPAEDTVWTPIPNSHPEAKAPLSLSCVLFSVCVLVWVPQKQPQNKDSGAEGYWGDAPRSRD